MRTLVHRSDLHFGRIEESESNSFNVVRIDRSSINVERVVWMPEQTRFSVASTQSFEFLLGGWVPP